VRRRDDFLEATEPLEPIGFVALGEGSSRTLYGAAEGTEPDSYTPSPGIGKEDSLGQANTTPSGEGLLYSGAMPSLEELLQRHQVAYTVLESRTHERIIIGSYALGVWTLLVLLGLVWGILTALAFVLNDFWLEPATAVFGCLGTVVLVITLVVHQRHEAAH
jgi:hypothetical protein